MKIRSFQRPAQGGRTGGLGVASWITWLESGRRAGFAVAIAMANSLGLGSYNAALVVRRYERGACCETA